MSDLLTASRSVGSWKCEPMTVDQIDAHSDRDRIWATIATIQSATDAVGDRMREEMEDHGSERYEDGQRGAREDCRDELADAIESLIENEEISDTLAAKIRKLKDAI